MPDVYPEAYNLEDVASFVRALESAEQYSMEYTHKMVKEELLYLDSGIVTIADGDSFYTYVENPSENEYGLVALEPTIEATGPLELYAYFNADVDTGTFTQKTVNNLSSAKFDEFSGDVWGGPSGTVTINDTGTDFYVSIVGTGKKSGGVGGGNLIAIIAPGDNLLFELSNNGALNSNTEVVASFQAPYHEQTEDFTL